MLVNIHTLSSSLSRFIIVLLIVLASSSLYAQNYTSIAEGNWTSASTWSPMQPWESATPSTTGGWGSVNIYHDLVLNGDYNLNYPLTIHNGASLTINGNLSGGSNINLNGGNLIVNGNLSGGTIINLNGGNLKVTGDFSKTGGGQVTVGDNATLTVHGNANLSARLQVNRGGKAMVDGNVTVNSSDNLIIAEPNNINPTEYADMIIKKDLISTSSGDVIINKNGRLAVYGNVTGSGGGTLFTVNRDGQVYVHGDMTFTGHTIITNNNQVRPYGFYVNGEVHNTANGGSSTTTNKGDQQTMFDTNLPFYEWVAAQVNSPLMDTLPVTLVDFSVSDITQAYTALQWSTASEYNNSHFIIMRSKDARNWEEIGILEGKGTSTTLLHYTFKDQSPVKGMSYYMLKQVDFDGMYETFAAIVAYNTVFDDQVKVFPNPTADFLNINFSANTLTEVTEVSLLDLQGNVIKRETVTSNTLNWDISDLKKATYILKASPENTSFTSQKIIKY